MKEEDQSEGKLELSLRILGNEIIGFKMMVDDFKIKFLLGGIAAMGIIASVSYTHLTLPTTPYV